MHLYVTGFWLLLCVLTALAWSGREVRSQWWEALSEPEVGVATLMMVAAILTVVIRPSFVSRFSSIELAMFAIDVGLFVGLAIYAARSGRWWILAASALQLISTTAHVTRAVTPGMWRLGYQVMEEASSYPTLLLLAWGVWSRHRSAKSARRSSTFSGVRDRPLSSRR
ncbi:hypothetical protein [Sphingomonas sp. 22R3R2A-7]|uniref:hypothetical protein n=1 Tax=Sphingomonas sp. 22R3R2A-7 TaxID=3050230 RepID=UPI002FE314D5